ncbi:MAG: hypothetical protein ACREI2_05870 [Nitrospiraceae bacterium]
MDRLKLFQRAVEIVGLFEGLVLEPEDVEAGFVAGKPVRDGQT